MREGNGLRKLDDDVLEKVVGGTQKAYLAALDLMNGNYGDDAASRKKLEEEGLDYWSVRHMANGLAQGYDQVAQDVIDGKYGTFSARYKALSESGFDARLVQDVVNGMIMDD